MTALSPIAAVAHDAATRPEQARRWAVNRMAHDLHAAVTDATSILRTVARQTCRNCPVCTDLRDDAERVLYRAAARWDAVEALGGGA